MAHCSKIVEQLLVGPPKVYWYAASFVTRRYESPTSHRLCGAVAHLLSGIQGDCTYSRLDQALDHQPS